MVTFLYSWSMRLETVRDGGFCFRTKSILSIETRDRFKVLSRVIAHKARRCNEYNLKYIMKSSWLPNHQLSLFTLNRPRYMDFQRILKSFSSVSLHCVNNFQRWRILITVTFNCRAAACHLYFKFKIIRYFIKLQCIYFIVSVFLAFCTHFLIRLWKKY